MASPSINTVLRDLILRRALRRAKMENACVRTVSREWRALRADVEAIVRDSSVFTGVRRPILGEPPQIRVAPLVTAVAHAIGLRMTSMVRCLNEDLPALATLELVELPDVIQRHLHTLLAHPTVEAEGDEPIRLSLTFSQVPVEQATALISSPLGGAFFSQSFGDLAAETLRALRNTLVSGIVQGKSVPQVARAVRGVLDVKKYQAERIVRSEYVRVANQAALLTYEQNADVLQGVQWQSTLDERVCVQCGFFDGKVWDDFRKAKIPVVDSHPNCRCVLLPVLKSAKELGISTENETTRASFDGQVAATTTYQDWLKQQTPAFQREILGPTRYRLYASGKARLKDFVGVNGVRPVRDVLAAREAK